MVSIKKRVIGSQEYYYLEHSIREKGKVQKKELYLGKTVPKNIAELQREFIYHIYKDRWFMQLDGIKRGYEREQKGMPVSSKNKELEHFMIKFTYDTNRIEGSKLTYRETADLLERGTTPKSKPLDDIKEAEAHRKVFYEILDYKKDLSLQILLFWHDMLFSGTKPDIAGRIREHQVGITGSKFMPPSPAEVPVLLKELFRWYDKSKARTHPIELAALIHLKLVTIHPFGDGNGRMSRLLMNFVLNRHGFPMLNIPSSKRSSYYTSLERSQVKGNDLIFLQWFFKRYIKEYGRYLKTR
ncbi:Fic/DOC family protein [uncultured archaeon]|nr:Fic/DOC family protein [uncultured archaeon]